MSDDILQSMEVMVIGGGYRRGQSEWFTILIINIFFRGYYLHCTSFLSLSVRESVVVSTIMPAHSSKKQGEMKIVSVLTRLSCSLVL